MVRFEFILSDKENGEFTIKFSGISENELLLKILFIAYQNAKDLKIHFFQKRSISSESYFDKYIENSRDVAFESTSMCQTKYCKLCGNACTLTIKHKGKNELLIYTKALPNSIERYKKLLALVKTEVEKLRK